MTAPPSFLRFLLAFLLAPLLIGGIGLAMMASRLPGIDGLGSVLAVSMICAAPAYLLAGGPLAWKAVKQGQPSRKDAVIWGLLANFASLLIIPALLALYFQWAGPPELHPDLAARWMETAPAVIETSFGSILFAAAAVFLLGILFAPLYALTAHALGRLLKVNRPLALSPEGSA